MPGLLDLPRELRDEIYACYVAQDGGYVYNQRTRRLRAANGGPIHVSLMQTCTQIARELRPVIFQSNTVTFRTGFVDRETSDRAASFAFALQFMHGRLAHQLFEVRDSITDDVIDRATRIFPKCLDMLHLIRGQDMKDAPRRVRNDLLQDCRFWRHSPSDHRRFIRFMLSLAEETKTMSGFETDDEALGQRHSDQDISSLITRIPEAWTIPNEEELSLLKETCRHWGLRCQPFLETGSHTINYYFSAAALAKQFLDSLDPKVMSTLRRIVLDEVHASVAYPECHGLGLVSMVQQYPNINICRQVDTRVVALMGCFHGDYVPNLIRCYEQGTPWNRHRGAERDLISKAFVRWFEEAVALSSNLPPDRFSIAFHSKDTGTTLAILEQVLEDARWQRTVVGLTAQPAGPLTVMGSSCFFSESFTRVARELQRGEGNVCFDIGDLHVADQDWQIHVDQNTEPRELGVRWSDTFRSTSIEPPQFSGWEDMLHEYMEDEVQDEVQDEAQDEAQDEVQDEVQNQ